MTIMIIAIPPPGTSSSSAPLVVGHAEENMSLSALASGHHPPAASGGEGEGIKTQKGDLKKPLVDDGEGGLSRSRDSPPRKFLKTSA